MPDPGRLKLLAADLAAPAAGGDRAVNHHGGNSGDAVLPGLVHPGFPQVVHRELTVGAGRWLGDLRHPIEPRRTVSSGSRPGCSLTSRGTVDECRGGQLEEDGNIVQQKEGDSETLPTTPGPVPPGEATSGPPVDTPPPGPGRSRPIRWILLATSALVVVPFLFLVGSQLGKDPTLVRSPLLGKPAPAFSLPRIDQPGTLGSTELAGKTYVVNFWSSWCVPCREETPALEDFYQRWRAKGVEVVGVLFSDTVKAAQEFRRQLGGTWPLVDDPGGRTTVSYGVFGVPETFVVDGRGVIMAKLVGAVAPGTLDGVLARLGQGTPIYEQNDQYRQTP